MKYYIVDAFTDKLFAGNPAGVCVVEGALTEEQMQNIAKENNLSETAFVSRSGDGYDLRWFTPVKEVNLCGHATLGTAFVISNFVDDICEMRFYTKSGVLTVCKEGDLFVMDFPSQSPKRTKIHATMSEAIGKTVIEAFVYSDTLVLVVENEACLQGVNPDFGLIAQLAPHAVIVTAKGESCDFVSRFFAPNVGVDEDPVTGSAHSILIPLWADKLGKTKLTARQISKRGGILFCENHGERVKIAGQAVLYLKGEINYQVGSGKNV
ncbi:MAG: PhzF family phenazine biosynthesis protein [Defluviitaleaceae bacterium]|nr:PhzF family phenazine biosynthesis protein [Defluviitaleaceae bacterium]